MPMAFAGGDLVTNLKEFGDAPVRTVSCVGAQGSGKSTLMRTMFGQGASNLALLEARSSAAYVPETNEFEVGAGQAMVSLAVSDATIYNVLVHDLHRPDAMSDVQVRRRPPYIKLGLVPQHGHYVNQNTAAAASGVVLQAASVQQRFGRITAVDTWGRKMMLLARPAHLWETLFKNALPPKHRPSAVVSLCLLQFGRQAHTLTVLHPPHHLVGDGCIPIHMHLYEPGAPRWCNGAECF